MKKLIMLSVIGLMATGMFANNKSTKSNKLEILDKKEVKDEKVTTKKDIYLVQITVNCSDGSSYTVSCSSCTTQQLTGIAWALCS